MSQSLRVTDFDHLVLNVTDTELALAFYCEELGMEPIRVDEWRRQEVFFPSVRVNGSTIVDLVQLPRTGENANHFCLVVEPMDFEELKQSGRFDVVEVPIGAMAPGATVPPYT